MLPVRSPYSSLHLNCSLFFLSSKSTLDVFVMSGLTKLAHVARQRSGSRSDLPSAAINEQFDTCDETGVIRRQKQRRPGNFIGFPHAAHRDGGHNPPNSLRRLSVDSRGVSRTGANDI